MHIRARNSTHTHTHFFDEQAATRGDAVRIRETRVAAPHLREARSCSVRTERQQTAQRRSSHGPKMAKGCRRGHFLLRIRDACRHSCRDMVVGSVLVKRRTTRTVDRNGKWSARTPTGAVGQQGDESPRVPRTRQGTGAMALARRTYKNTAVATTSEAREENPRGPEGRAAATKVTVRERGAPTKRRLCRRRASARTHSRRTANVDATRTKT